MAYRRSSCAGIVWCRMVVVAGAWSILWPGPLTSLRAQAPLTSWRVTEVWRTDGTDDGEPLADPRDLLALKDGTLWVLDFKDQKIRRFNPAGKELLTVGREGGGPGEFRNANGLLLHPDGTIWINDPLNARLTVFAPTGRYLRQHSVGNWGWGMRWDAWIEVATGRVADPVPRASGMGSAARGWRMITPTGARRDTVAQPVCPSGAAPPSLRYQAETKGKNRGMLMSRYPFTTGGGAAADGRGGFWCADAGSARAALLRLPNGDTVASTNIVLPPISVPRAERDSVSRAIRKQTARYATSDFDGSRLRDTKPGIAYLSVDYDGRLWVQHGHRFGVAGTTFDVHDSRGGHLGRLTIPLTLLHEGFMPVFARGDDVWAVVVNEDGVPSVARYRIKRH